MAEKRIEGRIRRKARVRKKIRGTAKRPRISVFKSAKHIYAQIIDDEAGRTLASMSTLDKSFREGSWENPTAKAKDVGSKLAELAISKGIETVVFDRGGFKYHGRVKALADGLREKGLKF